MFAFLIELDTRLNDWRAGGLTAEYFLNKLATMKTRFEKHGA